MPPILTICADLDGISGYSLHLLEIVRRFDCRVRPIAIRKLGEIPPEITSRITYNQGWFELYLRHPNIKPKNRNVGWFAMYETDRLPNDSTYILNGSRFVIVPSNWCMDSFKRSGVHRPIHVVPLGVDPNIYRATMLTDRSTLTVGTGGWLAHGASRKGLAWAVDVFRSAFQGNEDVSLMVKTLPSSLLHLADDPRITVESRFLPPAEMANWYRSIDVFLSGAKAEAFGFMQLESMACGRPVISVMYSGVTEFFTPAAGWVIGHKIVPATERYKGHGNWALPSRSDAIEVLRSIYLDRGQLKSKGEAAANLAQKFTWDASVGSMMQVLRGYGVID